MPTITLPTPPIAPPEPPRTVSALPLALELAEERYRRRDAELRYLILKSFVDSVQESGSWRLLAPLRALKNMLRPRGLTADNLIPWNNLERGENGEWRATGHDPQFVAPCC